MFARRYFPATFFAPRYWGSGGESVFTGTSIFVDGVSSVSLSVNAVTSAGLSVSGVSSAGMQISAVESV